MPGNSAVPSDSTIPKKSSCKHIEVDTFAKFWIIHEPNPNPTPHLGLNLTGNP